MSEALKTALAGLQALAPSLHRADAHGSTWVTVGLSDFNLKSLYRREP